MIVCQAFVNVCAIETISTITRIAGTIIATNSVYAGGISLTPVGSCLTFVDILNRQNLQRKKTIVKLIDENTCLKSILTEIMLGNIHTSRILTSAVITISFISIITGAVIGSLCVRTNCIIVTRVCVVMTFIVI